MRSKDVPKEAIREFYTLVIKICEFDGLYLRLPAEKED